MIGLIIAFNLSNGFPWAKVSITRAPAAIVFSIFTKSLPLLTYSSKDYKGPE
jgi:hypothetical protein